ncbi:hypothetical protein [Acidocella sp.]
MAQRSGGDQDRALKPEHSRIHGLILIADFLLFISVSLTVMFQTVFY